MMYPLKHVVTIVSTIALVVRISIVLSLPASAALIVEESFNYPDGTELTDGVATTGTGLTGNWTDNGQAAGGLVVNAAGGTYTDANGNILDSSGGQADQTDAFNQSFAGLGTRLGDDNTTVWMSMIFRPYKMNAGWGGMTLQDGGPNMGGDAEIIVGVGGGGSPSGEYAFTYKDGVGGDIDVSTGIAVTSEPVLILTKMEFQAGDDIYSMWVDPLLDLESNLGTAASATVPDFGVDTFRLDSRHNNPFVEGGFTDEIRFGDTFDDVTPFAASQAGDFDGDLDVDGADFLIWQRDLGDVTSHLHSSRYP